MTNQSQVGRTVRMLIALSAAAAAGYAMPAAAQDNSASENTSGQQQDDIVLAQAGGQQEGDAADAPFEVTITGRQQSAATDVMQERMQLPVVADLVGAEQISRVGDSTVSLALRRLPGVTLVGDQFIYVRGLGERYSSTTLNGAYVPSPDLTRNVIPLDLFPAEIIDSLSISKGYTVDQPAAFGGGNVDIRTLAIPEDFLFRFQIGSGWDSNSSDKALTYTGGSDDRIGTDDGTRALPSEILDAVQQYQGNLSTSGILQGLRRTNPNATFADAQAINRQLATSLNRNIGLREKSVDPDVALEGALGNSWDLGESGDWKLGVLGIADYKNQWRNRDFSRASSSFPATVRSDIQRSINQVALTGSLNVGLQYADEHKVQVGGLYLRNTDDESSISLRNNGNFQLEAGQRLREYGIRFEERDLELFQVSGSHTLGDTSLALLGGLADLSFARDLNFSWYYSDAKAQTDIPNEVSVEALDRVDPATGQLISSSIRPVTSAADFRFTELLDEVKSYGWELSKPFELGDLKLTLSGGWDYFQKGRKYLETQISVGSNANGDFLSGGPQDVLTDENILNPANGFSLNLGGLGTESYLAGEIIHAYFGQFDLEWNSTWRFTGGVRWEDFKQLSVPIDQYEFSLGGIIRVPQDQLTSLAKAEDDYYPAFAITYKRPDFWADEFQLRFGWSRTTARPDLREVSDATYIDPLTEYRIRGNPRLVTADLTNYDIRADWFFGNGDSFTISTFYKDISDPIETVQGAGSDDDIVYTFVNGDSAEIYGVELEWLKGLGFLSGRLGEWTNWFFVAGNLMVADSEITVGQAALNLTNNKHPLSQASEYVANIQLGFDSPGGMHNATLVYNGTGERLFSAGRGGAPDAYEQPFHSLDATYSFYPTDSLSFKLRVQNILGDKVNIKQGGTTILQQDIGTTFKIDATMRF